MKTKHPTVFKNLIPDSKLYIPNLMFKYYAKKFKFNPTDFPVLKSIPSDPEYDDFGIQHIYEASDKVNNPIEKNNSIVVGTIRMGFGHCRISLALASAARHLGYTPYWMDLMAFPETAATKTIDDMEKWYNLGSRLSQRSSFFNKHVWENITSEGGRYLSATLRERTVSKLYTPLFHDLPNDMPFLSTHPWVGHGAVEAGMKNVVNIIPDNYPLAFWLVEGSVHTVQSPSTYMGYRTLFSMGEHHNLQYCLPNEQIYEVGHYVDHEIVSNIESDCTDRIKRLKNKAPRRVLLTMGGAGAQVIRFADIVKNLKPAIDDKKAVFFINMGDHEQRWNDLKIRFDRNKIEYQLHQDWNETKDFVNYAKDKTVTGVHVFLHKNFYAAVYSTNILMRICDVMITKPSELSFYPVPKLFIQRVGRHEAWGAIRGSEIGDGTIETGSLTSMHRTLNLIVQETDLIELYCSHILRNHRAGIYNGAYNAVKLVTQGSF